MNRVPRPSEITKIVISVNCLAPCIGYQIGLYPDGTYRYTQDGLPPEDEERGRIPFTPFANSLVGTEFFHDRTSYEAALGDQETDVWVEYASTRKSVVLATAAHDQPSLRHFIEAVDASVADARSSSRQALVARLTDYQHVRSIQMQVGGCLGSCRGFDVSFGRNGKAQIEYTLPRDYPNRSSAIAFVDFARVLRILKETGYESLRPQYPYSVTDTEVTRLIVRYSHFTYTVYAPDSTSRPAVLTEILGRVDQLVEDANWQPPLPVSAKAHA